jgi:hypothetical protein
MYYQISLLIAIFSMQGFVLNNIPVITRHLSIIVVVMVIMVGSIMSLCLTKNWSLINIANIEDIDK